MDKQEIGQEIQRLIAKARPAPAVVRRAWLGPVAAAAFAVGAGWGYSQGVGGPLYSDIYGDIEPAKALPAGGGPAGGGPGWKPCLAQPGAAWPDIEVVYRPDV